MTREIYCPGGCITDLSTLSNDETIMTEDGGVMCLRCFDREDEPDFLTISDEELAHNEEAEAEAEALGLLDDPFDEIYGR